MSLKNSGKGIEQAKQTHKLSKTRQSNSNQHRIERRSINPRAEKTEKSKKANLNPSMRAWWRRRCRVTNRSLRSRHLPPPAFADFLIAPRRRRRLHDRRPLSPAKPSLRTCRFSSKKLGRGGRFSVGPFVRESEFVRPPFYDRVWFVTNVEKT